jgi:hypothetical protein
MLINSGGGRPSRQPEELGFAPLVAALAPVAISLVGAAGKAIVNKIQGKPKPPPCTFWQKVGRVFGGKPACT